MDTDRDLLPPAVADLLEVLEGYLAPEDIPEVIRAWEVGRDAHEGQTRQSGEPYIMHPIAVARMLADMGMDAQTIIGAILHDTIEDTELTKEEVSRAFGPTVAGIVEGLTKLDKMHFSSQQEAAAESFRKMLLAMARDIRVILIKLADRLHNMRTIGVMRRDKQRRIAMETLDVYAPIAQRLGVDTFRRELQELAFKAMHPMRHRVIAAHAQAAQGRHEEKIDVIVSTLKARLGAEDITAEIDGRGKTPYSIYQKMKSKHMGLRDVLDLIGVRVIVETIPQCYLALGIVHSVYAPRFTRFKDYIAIPKANGYQSLHSVVVGPNSEPLEIQIRTEEMDVVAERGIAAHWAYKLRDNVSSHSTNRARDWLFSVLEMQRQSGSSQDFLDHVKLDLFPDEVYVFTPDGEIRSLPRNATVLDFAYSVHTYVGDHAVQAWVDNHRLVPLHYRLASGESVNVITAKSARPRPNWLESVVTSKARTAIRYHLRNLAHEEAVRLGHLMLDGSIGELGLTLDRIGDEVLNRLLEELKFQRLEDLLADIALGNRKPATVARQLAAMLGDEDALELGSMEAIPLSGAEQHIVTYPACCHPIPGDRVIGYLSVGKGLVVHRQNCRNMKELRKHPDRWMPVEWESRPEGMFSVLLKVDVGNRQGVLARVASSIASSDTNIINVENRERDSESSELWLTLSVRDRRHLARVMRRIRGLPDVTSVHRLLS